MKDVLGQRRGSARGQLSTLCIEQITHFQSLSPHRITLLSSSSSRSIHDTAIECTPGQRLLHSLQTGQKSLTVTPERQES